MNKIHLSNGKISKTDIANLHTAMKKMKLEISPEEINAKTLGATSVNAIKELEKRGGSPITGELTEHTIDVVNKELFHAHHAFDKTRTAKLQTLLTKVGLPIAADERNKRTTGDTTRAAVEEFQKRNGLPVDGKITEAVMGKLQDEAIKASLSAKTQVGGLQTKLIKALNIAKLDIRISEDELKSKTVGATTTEAIKAFQAKYRLTNTGELNKTTLDKLESVAASRGIKQKKVNPPAAHELSVVTGQLRLNMTNAKVGGLQQALSHLGYKINESEFKANTFGKTTREAVLAFQKENGLPETGHVEALTQRVINQEIIGVNPTAAAALEKYRIRGSVRDEQWRRKENMVIRIYEKLVNGESAQPLVTKKNMQNGFFDITYNPPLNPVTKQTKEPFHLVVKLYEPVNNDPAQDKLIGSQIHYNVNRIHWVNFTQSETSYKGDSDFKVTRSMMVKAIGPVKIEELQETENNRQITHVSIETGLSTDDIMRQVLAHRVAVVINKPNPITPEVIYAFLRQNLPPDLPGDLLRGTSDWETIDQMTEKAASGIVFANDDLQQQTVDNALSQNLVSQAVKLNRDAILQELKNMRNTFTLEKPILVGNGSLKSLLDESKIDKQHYSKLANNFITAQGINPGFWTELRKEEATIGSEAINDFATTVEVGNLSKNHIPTLQFLKQNIGTEAGKKFKTASDIAKLDQDELVALINQNGRQVPDNIPGASTNEKVVNYAAAIKTRADLLFPAVSLVAAVKRSGTARLEKVAEIETFIDEQTGLNFRQQNIDKYLAEKGINLDAKTKEEIKVVQRIHKLTTDSKAGATLVDEGLHSSQQLYFMGKDRLMKTLTDKGIDAKQAQRLYEFSKAQYMQVLARLIDFRRETASGTPQAIVPQTYSREELQAVLGDIPNLEMLFGSLDYCDCEHCKSLFGPAAYFTDLLRFLKEHDSMVTQGGRTLTVKDVLFDRRPDLGNIKLNCENTNTALPYIDLVCEILENNIAPQQKNFSYQTTLSQKELRAVPQYIRPAAYQTLATADYPMSYSYNLWQDEARTYLNYLRIPRHELMEAFQDVSDPANKVPGDAAIAAEYFGFSSFEKTLIITPRPANADQNRYWGTDTTQNRHLVSLFLKRTKLTYLELLELLLVKFVNDPANNKSIIERPVDTCDTGVQQITNLSVQKFDLMHRFIRLWRKAGWKAGELDLLLRNAKIGNNAINGDTLTHLKKFRQLQEKLNLPFEILLAFYGNINTEQRVRPDKPEVIVHSLYDQLFQNRAVTNPVDAKFALDANRQHLADETLPLALNAGYTPLPTILSALALRQTDFDLLAAKTDNHLSIASLSVLLRYAYLAKGLKLTVKDLLLLLKITNVSDPFATLQTTLDCIGNLEFIKASGWSLQELNYVLNYSPEAPVGVRTESLVQMIEALRRILSSNKEKTNQMALSDGDGTAILSFDADALVPMTDPQVIAAFTPLQNVISARSSNFTNAGLAVEEVQYLAQFDAAAITPAGKTKLIESIKKLKRDLTDLFNQNENQITSQVASTFVIENELTDTLLHRLTLSPAPDSLLAVLKRENLLEKNPDGTFKEILEKNPDGSYKDIATSPFFDQFKVYSLLHKVALLVSKMRLGAKDAKWFIENASAANMLRFSALPVTAMAAPNDFAGWLNLYKFLDFKSAFPEPEAVSIRSILDLAKNPASTKSAIQDEIVKLTQWKKDDLVVFDAKFRLQHAAGHLDYTAAELYSRLRKSFAQMQMTGVDADTMFAWALINDDLSHDGTVALQTRNALKSKYEQEDWLGKITPLHDDIRDRKRKALVEYHLEDSQRNQAETVAFNGRQIPNPLYWKDSNALFKYFLIDVEMSSCQLTSRIKQAISSVQLFVQRCFLNLENRYVRVSQDEREDVASPNAWSQWKWMKAYRIWEANRKIFFYPENWLEPELRDDKSPFFEELENEILQNEMTHENAEAAFLNYLHKVDEVAHLDVCGLYHEMENLTGDETMYEVNKVHVIGRTKAIPHLYFYRVYDMNYSNWTAWEKIEVDITGDQVVPVIYNRKLHLFWLQFMEKPMRTRKVPPAQPTSGPTEAPEPMKMMEIQLGWTSKKQSGWSAKKISKQKLVHPWERPHHSYNLKPYYQERLNELYLDIYLSTSEEFNNTRFYDPDKTPAQNPVYRTGNRFNETYLPWHSSSFVFDGEVRDVKLKGLGGRYRLFWQSWVDLWLDDSYDYVHDNFGEDGKKIKELDPQHEYGPRLRLPTGMHFQNTHLTNNVHDSTNTNELRVLENNNTTTLLRRAASNGAVNGLNHFELVITQQDLQLNTATDHPLFYQDNQRAFFIKPEWEAILNNYGQVTNRNRKYRFQPFYHPYTTIFLRELNRSGLDGLLNRRIQVSPRSFPKADAFDFNSYQPASNVIGDDAAVSSAVDFSFGGAYSIYNWELFFHAPLMIACRLTQNQKFEEAMRWFHYIFDPTNIANLPTPQRYWITKPFFEYNSEAYRRQRIENILLNIQSKENQDQLNAWKNNPFKPHLIARYRPVAYQRNVVMKYLDNLIAWGDQLFRRDTIESINEATLLYVLAYEILGDRPQKVPNVKHEELTFNELEPKLDDFGNARLDVVIEDTLLPVNVVPASTGTEPMPKIETFYFCIPNNDYLFKYWDTVEDRLFKIHHCMNIEGIVRQLPLFEPPIDPALLVKAAAAGMDLGSVLNDASAPTPHYRFRMVVQKAVEFCNEVKTLGEKLLNALEKKDAEELSLLRSQHEIQLQEAVKEIRKKQIDEAVETIGSLNTSKDIADKRKNYYSNIPRMNEFEIGGVLLHGGAIISEIVATVLNTVAAGAHLVPKIKAGASGFGGSPTLTVEMGGENVGNSSAQFAALFQGLSTILHSTGSLLELQGSYTRRDNENKFQADVANTEVGQIQFQINAAEIRQAIAEKELENQELQIENARTVDDYMRNKFTNQQLYNYMLSQIATVYFQAYQLAYDMAKKAEKCYQYELGIQDSSFIQFGYWDSLKKGLLSGDKLMNDLRRLEAAYMDQNRRELEIAKHISLAQMLPLSLITLKETGECTVSLPEWLFDMDYPGHYMRRIKNVSLTIPCIVGPYTGVNCTLSLLRNETRVDPSGAYDKVDENDPRFRVRFGAISSIATSHAQNDSGTFELNFNDDRYLPFEGAGVASDWQISMPKENNYFDFATITDVILHVNYTARNSGGTLKANATTNLNTILPNSAARLFSLKHEFATEWHKFLNPEGGADQELVISLKPEHFPFFIRGKLNTLKLKNMDVFVETSDASDFTANIQITNAAPFDNLAISQAAEYNNVHHAAQSLAASQPNPLGELRLKIKLSAAGDFKSLPKDKIDNLFILFQLGKPPFA